MTDQAPESTDSRDTTLAEERPHPLTPLVQVWVWLVALAVFGGRQLIENPDALSEIDPTQLSWPLLIVAAIGLASVSSALYAWWTTRFVVTDDALRVDNRGVQHQSRRVAYRRIQAVDINQPFAARLLGMAELSIDVGGDSPVKLRYLSLSRAQQLRSFLIERAALSRQPRVADASDEGRHRHDAAPTDTVLLRVGARELLLGAAMSHELLGLVIAGAVPVVLGIVFGQGWLVGTGALPIVLAIAGFVSSRVISQYAFTLADTGTGLRITRGLTSLASQVIPTHRVQAIQIEEPVLWRRFGRARVALSLVGMAQVSADGGGIQTTSVLLPIGSQADVTTALHSVWPDLDLAGVALQRPPHSARWLAPLSYRWLGYGWNDRVFVQRSGWWTRRTWVIPHARIQSVQAETDPYQRQLRLASITIHFGGVDASSPAYVPHDHAADFLFDELTRARLARAAERRAAEAERASISAPSHADEGVSP